MYSHKTEKTRLGVSRHGSSLSEKAAATLVPSSWSSSAAVRPAMTGSVPSPHLPRMEAAWLRHVASLLCRACNKPPMSLAGLFFAKKSRRTLAYSESPNSAVVNTSSSPLSNPEASTSNAWVSSFTICESAHAKQTRTRSTGSASACVSSRVARRAFPPGPSSPIRPRVCPRNRSAPIVVDHPLPHGLQLRRGEVGGRGRAVQFTERTKRQFVVVQFVRRRAVLVPIVALRPAPESEDQLVDREGGPVVIRQPSPVRQPFGDQAVVGVSRGGGGFRCSAGQGPR
jgi:hypothetical protein